MVINSSSSVCKSHRLARSVPQASRYRPGHPQPVCVISAVAVVYLLLKVPNFLTPSSYQQLPSTSFWKPGCRFLSSVSATKRIFKLAVCAFAETAKSGIVNRSARYVLMLTPTVYSLRLRVTHVFVEPIECFSVGVQDRFASSIAVTLFGQHH